MTDQLQAQAAALEACPMCGGVSVLYENDWCEPHEWHVYCGSMECGTRGPNRLTAQVAIAAWNRRERRAGATVRARCNAALQRGRRAGLEEAAKVADAFLIERDLPGFGIAIARAIHALATKQEESKS